MIITNNLARCLKALETDNIFRRHTVCVFFPIKQWNQTSVTPTCLAASALLLLPACFHYTKINTGSPGSRHSPLQYSERERERESCSDVESSRGWPLSFHLPLTRSHISSLRHPNHKVRNTASYKGDLGVGVELHAHVSSILFKSPDSTQSKCDYIKNNCVSLLSRRMSKRSNKCIELE